MENGYSEIRRQMIKRQLMKYRNVQGLMRYINVDTLFDEHRKQNGKKATGIDKVTKEEYGKNLGLNLNKLVNNMKAFKYKPKAVKRVYIPKANGKLRPLGLPSYEDKLVQGVMANILNEIYELIFLDCSCGFRPNRDCHMAIDKIDKIVMHGNVNYVVEADIKGFFDNVNHEWLIKFLEVTIKDKNFIRYIKRFLKAGIMEDLKYHESEKGTPQGGLISPVLANVYLHYVLDLWFKVYVQKECKGKCQMVRYADDFVCFFERKEEAKWFYKKLVERLAKFNLEVEETKTRIFPIGRNSKDKESFDFLGFTIYDSKTRNGYYKLGYKTSEKKSKLKKQHIKKTIKENRQTKPKDLIKILNKILIGYFNYYGISFNYDWLAEIYYYTFNELKKWLSRRSQRGAITWEKMRKIIEFNPLVKPRITYSLWQ